MNTIRLELNERQASLVRASLDHTIRYASYILERENLNVIQDAVYQDFQQMALDVQAMFPDELPAPVAPFLEGQLGGIAPRPVHDPHGRPVDDAAAEEQAIRLRQFNQFLL